jgi:hypothetical protein
VSARKHFLTLSKNERLLEYAIWEHWWGNDKAANRDITDLCNRVVKEELEEQNGKGGE